MKMRLGYRVVLMACAVVLAFTMAASANMLANPGFENGDLSGWGVFGNCYPETPNPGEPGNIVPWEGDWVCKMFGNWSGGFNVSGIFQEFPTCPGDGWKFRVKSRHSDWDPMSVDGVDDNWVVMKIAWFDAANVEIGGVEATILDGTFPTQVWYNNAPIYGTAPAGAVKMQALVLYLQPLFDGGSAHIDDCELIYLGGPSATEITTWGQIKTLYR
jgi:hypothetical protein